MQIQTKYLEGTENISISDIIKELNKRFTAQEAMKQRIELHCLDIARENGLNIYFDKGNIIFSNYRDTTYE